jgi:hypothetical protein
MTPDRVMPLPPAAGLRHRTRHRSEIRGGAQGRRPPHSAPEGSQTDHRGTRRESVPCTPVPGPAGWNPRREEIPTSSPARQGADRRSRSSLSSSLIRTRPTGYSASIRPPAAAGQHRPGPTWIMESGIAESVSGDLEARTTHTRCVGLDGDRGVGRPRRAVAYASPWSPSWPQMQSYRATR